MDREALHERVRRLGFSSRVLAESFSRGEFRSVFRGRGLEFDSIRPYFPEDDARQIDWNVTARLARPYLRSFKEERSLVLFLVVDLSPSMDVGSGELSKRDQALLATSLLAHAARFRGLRTGCVYVDRGILSAYEPRSGAAQARALVEAGILAAERVAAGLPPSAAREWASGGQPAAVGPHAAGDPRAAVAGTGLAEGLRAARTLLKRRSLLILLSDFREEGYEDELRLAARRHDLVAVRLTDRLDRELPREGSFIARDPESGAESRLSLGSRRLRAAWAAAEGSRLRRLREELAGAGASLLELDAAEDPALALIRFFERRRA